MSTYRLILDPTACKGHALCHDLFPEGIALDDWGYPIITKPTLNGSEARHARRAAAACPCLALKIVAEQKVRP
jgi:ferredoxin